MPVDERLLLLDVDGTLLPYGGTVSPGVLQALRRAQEAGVHMAVVTGRSWPEFRPAAARIPIEGPLACANGAAIYADRRGKALRVHRLPRQTALHTVSRLKERDALFWVYFEHQALIERKLVERFQERSVLMERGGWRARLESMRRARSMGFRPVADVLAEMDRVGSPPTHIGVSSEEEASEAVLTRLRAWVERLDGANVVQVTPWSFDILPAGCDKGEALVEIAALYGLPVAGSIMVGDNYNDLPAFRQAGLAVAMGNAPDPVKEQAAWVAPSVDADGVAVVIDRLLNGEL